MGLPIKGVLRYQIRVPARVSSFSIPSYVADTPEAPARMVRRRTINPYQLFAPLVGNNHETIAWFHGSFALLFSRLFIGHASNPKRSHQRGLRKWDGIKQRLLI